MNLSSDDKFWIKDPAILLKNGNYLKIIPTDNMTYVQKLNAVTRFLLYLTIVLLLFSANVWIILIPIIGIVVVIIMYYYMKKRLKNDISIREENFTNQNIEPSTANENNNGEDSTNNSPENFTEESPIYLKNINGKNICCQLPSKNNPMMNVTMADLMDNVQRAPACTNTKKIRAQIDKLLSDTESSQRYFYTMPSTTIPNDQTAFAEFLYPKRQTCKENQLNCLRYEDLRFSRHNPDIDSPCNSASCTEDSFEN